MIVVTVGNIWCQVLGRRGQVTGARCQVPGGGDKIVGQPPGTWHQATNVPNSGRVARWLPGGGQGTVPNLPATGRSLGFPEKAANGMLGLTAK